MVRTWLCCRVRVGCYTDLSVTRNATWWLRLGSTMVLFVGLALVGLEDGDSLFHLEKYKRVSRVLEGFKTTATETSSLPCSWAIPGVPTCGRVQSYRSRGAYRWFCRPSRDTCSGWEGTSARPTSAFALVAGQMLAWMLSEALGPNMNITMSHACLLKYVINKHRLATDLDMEGCLWHLLLDDAMWQSDDLPWVANVGSELVVR